MYDSLGYHIGSPIDTGITEDAIVFLIVGVATSFITQRDRQAE